MIIGICLDEIAFSFVACSGEMLPKCNDSHAHGKADLPQYNNVIIVIITSARAHEYEKSSILDKFEKLGYY